MLSRNGLFWPREVFSLFCNPPEADKSSKELAISGAAKRSKSCGERNSPFSEQAQNKKATGTNPVAQKWAVPHDFPKRKEILPEKTSKYFQIQEINTNNPYRLNPSFCG